MTASTGAADSRLAALAIHRLIESGHTLAVAESCTGGSLGSALTSVPGSSQAFVGGVIAYDDEIKRDLLGVSAETLERHGAVSGAVARSMAEGARKACRTDWGVAITGVAGPGGGTPEKPVGTVWIAVDGRGCTKFVRTFAGDRDSVRRQAVACALDALVTLLENAE